jgi:hypothetical protein
VGQLRGDEICEECSGKIESTWKEVDKISKRGMMDIQKRRDKIIAQLENAKRNVIKSE